MDLEVLLVVGLVAIVVWVDVKPEVVVDVKFLRGFVGRYPLILLNVLRQKWQIG